MTKVANRAFYVVNHVGIWVLGRKAVIYGEHRVARRCQEVRAIGLAAALAVTALITAAVDDDGDGVNARPLRSVIVHGELLAIGLAIDQSFLRRFPRIGGAGRKHQKRCSEDQFRSGPGHRRSIANPLCDDVSRTGSPRLRLSIRGPEFAFGQKFTELRRCGKFLRCPYDGRSAIIKENGETSCLEHSTRRWHPTRPDR